MSVYTPPDAGVSCDTEVEPSWELRASRDDRNKCRSTLRWTRASRATRRLNPPGNCAPLSIRLENIAGEKPETRS